jgi:hypothetical protein
MEGLCRNKDSLVLEKPLYNAIEPGWVTSFHDRVSAAIIYCYHTDFGGAIFMCGKDLYAEFLVSPGIQQSNLSFIACRHLRVYCTLAQGEALAVD